jgi:hypothetical protein
MRRRAHRRPEAHAISLALEAYDLVAYFTGGKPVKGSEEFETLWMGAKWRFASAESMKGTL